MIKSCFRLRPKVLRLGLLLRVPMSPLSTSAAIGMSQSDEQLLPVNRNGHYNVSVGRIIRGDEGEEVEPIRKLGWGVNSTVWLVRNRADTVKMKYVALKILSKLATREHESTQNSELYMLLRTHIGKEPDHRPQTPIYTGPPHPGWFRVSGMIGYFTCDNGQHLIIVLPMYGEHMRDYMNGEPDGRLAPALVRQIAKETLQALDYLHGHCGIIHCDVKPENLLRDFNFGPRIDDIIEAVLKKEPDAGSDGSLAPLWVPHVDEPGDLHIALTDFSHATWNDLITRSPRNIGSPALKAPELVVGLGFTTAIDIWAFGCTMFEFLSGESLFRFPDSRDPNELAGDPHYHLSLMQSLLGEPLFPVAARGTTTVKKGFIDSDGWIKSPLVKGDTLDERIANSLSHVEDKDKFAEFLRRCLRIDPGARASASDLLDDPWLASS